GVSLSVCLSTKGKDAVLVQSDTLSYFRVRIPKTPSRARPRRTESSIRIIRFKRSGKCIPLGVISENDFRLPGVEAATRLLPIVASDNNQGRGCEGGALGGTAFQIECQTSHYLGGSCDHAEQMGYGVDSCNWINLTLDCSGARGISTADSQTGLWNNFRQ